MKETDHIRRDTRQFYNNVADKFSQTRRHWWVELNFIRKYLKREGKLLDFGCGNGRLLEFLNSKEIRPKTSELEYLGLDISEKLIAHAKAKHPNQHFEVIEKESSLPVETGSMDIITSIAVFHHFNPSMAKEALQEFQRVLKKDGILVITSWYLWNKQYIGFWLKNVLKGKFSLGAPITFKDNDQGTYYRYCYWWTKSKLERLAKQTGFEILETGYTVDSRGRKRNIYLVLKKP